MKKHRLALFSLFALLFLSGCSLRSNIYIGVKVDWDMHYITAVEGWSYVNVSGVVRPYDNELDIFNPERSGLSMDYSGGIAITLTDYDDREFNYTNGTYAFDYMEGAGRGQGYIYLNSSRYNSYFYDARYLLIRADNTFNVNIEDQVTLIFAINVY